MKKSVSIGFITAGIVTSLLWGTIAILHYFLFSTGSTSSLDAWFKAFIEVQNRLAFNPYVLIALVIFGLPFIILIYLERYSGKSNTPATALNITAGGTAALGSWVLIALFNYVFFGETDPKALSVETKYFLSLFKILWDIGLVNYLLTLIFFISGGIFGRGVLQRLWPGLQFESTLQEFLFSTATGLGVLALAIFLIGLVHILYSWMVLLLLIGALAFGLKYAPSYPTDLWKAVTSARLKGLALGLFAVLLIIIALSIAAPLYPAQFYDSMNSHLEAPEVFIRDHAIKFHAYINTNNFPMGIELLYVPMLMLSRDLMTKITTFFFFLMCLGVVYEFGRVYLKSPTAGMLSALLLCLIPHIAEWFIYPAVDIPLMFYIALSALALAGWLYSGRDKYLYLTGLTLGFSFGIKYTALPLLLIFIVWILIQRFALDKRPARETFSKIGVMLVITVIVCSPWYLRNIVLFGNPFFPFYDHIFGKILPFGTLNELKPQLVLDQEDMLKVYKYEGDWKRSFLFLAHISLTDKAGPGPTKTLMGPLYIAILPLLILVGISGLGKLLGKHVLKWPIELEFNLPVIMSLFIVIAYSFYWIFIVGEVYIRYLFPIMPFMAFLAGYTLNRIFKLEDVNPHHFVTYFLLGCFGMLSVLYFNSILTWKISELPLKEESREEFIASYIKNYDSVKYLNRTLGPGDIAYGFFCQDGRYYANFTLIGGLYGYANYVEFGRHTGSGVELYEHLKGFGCSHLIVDKKRPTVFNNFLGYPIIDLPDDQTFKNHFQQIWAGKSTVVYKITD